MHEIRRGTDGQNALPNVADEEVGLGSPAETEKNTCRKSQKVIS